MDSQYYELELNIRGHKTLKECLDEFFEVMPTVWSPHVLQKTIPCLRCNVFLPFNLP